MEADMRKLFELITIVFAVFSISSGCMRAISKEVRAQIDEIITLHQVMEDHAAFQGKMVLWGGVIVEAMNLKEGALPIYPTAVKTGGIYIKSD